jgi:hypothetical protein
VVFSPITKAAAMLNSQAIGMIKRDEFIVKCDSGGGIKKDEC